VLRDVSELSAVIQDPKALKDKARRGAAGGPAARGRRGTFPGL
jgi:hypothetical protein